MASYPRFQFTLHFGESGVVKPFSFLRYTKEKAASYPRLQFTLHLGESGVVSSFSFYGALKGKRRRMLVFVLRYT